MAANSPIEWTNATWNPITGCTEVSPGCDHCYAKTFAERWRGIPGHPYEQGFDLKLWPDRLTLPLTWKKPRRIFVNSMSDLFHKDVPDAYIDRVFGAMIVASQHIYQVLTKRPKRMARYFASEGRDTLIWIEAYDLAVRAGHSAAQRLKTERPAFLPLHIWLGTSIESDACTWRADYLRKVPAAVRFISAEPLLSGLPSLNLDGIHWLIVGGESGHGARPMHPDWARSLRDQAQAAGVAFFFKQHGEYVHADDCAIDSHKHASLFCAGGTAQTVTLYKVGKHAAGRLLDGVEWSQFPDEVPA